MVTEDDELKERQSWRVIEDRQDDEERLTTSERLTGYALLALSILGLLASFLYGRCN